MAKATNKETAPKEVSWILNLSLREYDVNQLAQLTPKIIELVGVSPSKTTASWGASVAVCTKGDQTLTVPLSPQSLKNSVIKIKEFLKQST